VRFRVTPHLHGEAGTPQHGRNQPGWPRQPAPVAPFRCARARARATFACLAARAADGGGGAGTAPRGGPRSGSAGPRRAAALARSDKTEKATPQRRREARKEGTVAKSQEIGVAVSLLAGLLVLRVFAGPAAETVRSETRRLLTFGVTSELPGAQLASSTGRMLFATVVPFVTAGTLAAVMAGVAQVGFKPTPKAAMPKLSHLSPKKGLQRFKPVTAGWELVRTAVKVGALALIVWAPMRDWMDDLARTRGLEASLDQAVSQSFALLLRVLVLAVAIAAADYAYNRWKTARDLRMSKHDVKQEHKNAEGDPLVKGQRRRRQSELSRNRMLRDLAGADVVVVNPTHVAVALRYGEGDAAPRVVARGADHLARRIRREAHRIGIPVRQDVPLARALYRQCRLGQHVPAALYEAVAVVLAAAYRQRSWVPEHALAGAAA
jgi:flagellar biosynthesis protein FlhB